MYYNVGRVHQTLRVTPAMEPGTGITSGPSGEIVGLSDRKQAVVIGILVVIGVLVLILLARYTGLGSDWWPRGPFSN